MQIRNLGGSGLRVSAVGLGCNNFGGRIDLEASRKVIHKAIDLGITLFDTADIYGQQGGSETVLGEVLGDRRKDIVLATKFGKPMEPTAPDRAPRAATSCRAVEASLKRLKTDWIDLYQLHRPDPADADRRDAARARRPRAPGQGPLHRLLQPAGLADRRGALDRARIMNVARFVSCQNEYSLVVRGVERELMPARAAYGLGLLPYFPLASGLLTGKYKRGAACRRVRASPRPARRPGPLRHRRQLGRSSRS